jgi:fumarate hydratase subunit beta
MRVVRLDSPPSREDVLALRVGDLVYLSGEVTVTGGLPAHKRIVECIERGEDLPVPMDGTFIHLPHMVEEDGAGYRIHYVNPTTSRRFDGFMPLFIRHYGLRIVGGKGGLGPDCVAAMRQTGCVYLSLLGGGSSLLSDAIKQVLQVEWKDFPAHFRLSRLHVEDLGPLTVGIDAHGNSVYEEISRSARERLPAIMARLAERRGNTARKI